MSQEQVTGEQVLAAMSKLIDTCPHPRASISVYRAPTDPSVFICTWHFRTPGGDRKVGLALNPMTMQNLDYQLSLVRHQMENIK